MKLSKLPIALLAIMIAMGVAGPGWAHGGGGHHHGHVGVGVFVGGPLWWPGYYPYAPYYYYPPAVAVPASPPPPTAYIEQDGDSQGYWYYCNSSRTYYPYVQQCPEGWQQVMPRPPS